MKYFIFFILILSFNFSSFASEESWENNSYKAEYQQVVQALKRSKDINEEQFEPGSLYSFFETQCNVGKMDVTLEKQETSQRKSLLFHCESNNYFLVRLNNSGHLIDFQYLKAPPPFWGQQTTQKSSFPRDWKQTLVIGTALATGIIVASPVAQTFYPDQKDKYLHVLAGDFIAASSTLAYYHAYHFGTGAAWGLGFGTGVLAGILKEVYDKKWGPRKKADQADAFATLMGAAIGSSLIRITLEY